MPLALGRLVGGLVGTLVGWLVDMSWAGRPADRPGERGALDPGWASTRLMGCEGATKDHKGPASTTEYLQCPPMPTNAHQKTTNYEASHHTH